MPRGTLALAAAFCAMGAFATLAVYEIVVVRYVKHCIGRAKPVMTAFIAFPLGHAIGQAMLSGGALRYRMYTPAGFSATEVGATVLLANLPYALAFGLLLDISLVVAAETLEPMFGSRATGLRTLGCIGLAKDAGYVLRSWHAEEADAARRLGREPANAGDDGVAVGRRHHRYRAGLDGAVPAAAGRPRVSPICRSSATYLASMLAGVLSHVPAGLGVLESMLLLLLPDVPPEQLLAAVLMYRAIYEIVPMLIALASVGVFRRIRDDGVRYCA